MQARLVAENELVIRIVRQRQLDAIERRLVTVTKSAAKSAIFNEHEAMRAAVSDLKRLERYERRTWSRLKRAMRDLIDLKCGPIQA
jgi:hypothetical protein